jgi:hypothetical protein
LRKFDPKIFRASFCDGGVPTEIAMRATLHLPSALPRMLAQKLSLAHVRQFVDDEVLETS